MSSSPKQGSTTTVAQQAPFQAPFLNTGNYTAQALLNRGPYTGPYVASQSPETLQGIQLGAQRGLNGSPVQNAADQQLQSTIGGNYLTPDTNPYLSGAVNDALGLAKSQYAGMYGGPAGTNLSNTGFQEGLQRTLANTALPIYAGAYQTGREDQLRAAALAPNASAQDFLNLGALQQAGQTQDAYQQALVNAQQLAFNAPWTNLQNFQNIVSGGQGGITSGQSPYFTNPMANALGLGTGALNLYKMYQGLSTPAAASTVADPLAADAGANLTAEFGAAAF